MTPDQAAKLADQFSTFGDNAEREATKAIEAFDGPRYAFMKGAAEAWRDAAKRVLEEAAKAWPAEAKASGLAPQPGEAFDPKGSEPIDPKAKRIAEEKARFLAFDGYVIHVKTAPWVAGPERSGLVYGTAIRTGGQINVHSKLNQMLGLGGPSWIETFPDLDAMLENWVGD